MRRRRNLLILFLILLALRLSLSVIIEADEAIGMRADSYGYISLADNMVFHGKYHIGGESTLDLFRTPGYPVFLALIFWTFGKHLWLVALVQLTLSSLTAWLVYRIGVRSFSPSIGLFGGMLAAVLPNTAAWSLIILSETLFTLLIVLGVYYLLDFSDQPEMRTALLGSVFLGLAILVRPIGLILAPAWAAILIWYSPGGRKVWARLRYTLVFIGVIIALLLPWMVRNAIVWDTFSLSTVSKWNLGYYIAPAVLAEAEGITLEEARDRIPVSNIPDSEEAFVHTGILLGHPMATAKVWLTSMAETLFGYGRTNLSALWGQPYDIGEVFSLLRQGKLGAWLESLSEPGQLKALFTMAILLGTPIMIVIFAAAGGVDAWRSGGLEKKTAVLFIATILALLLPVIGVGNARFRVPMEPFLVLLGASGLTHLVGERFLRTKENRSSASEISG